jgi:hypothetical protein
MLDVIVEGDRLRFGERLAVSFHRTLRIPDDGRTYPLPPGFGLFPILSVGAASGAASLIPLYQREALWLGFSAASWKPNALKVIVGGINAVSGRPDDGAGLGSPQDYLVCPDQPWLDGFNAGGDVIRQFVAMPLGQGYGIETGFGRPEQGGLEIVAFDPLPGRFPDAPPSPRGGPMRLSMPKASADEPREMTLGAGGRMRQKIYPDRYGAEVWDQRNAGRARIQLVNSRRYRELTGRAPPPTPIDAAAYTAAGLPWFDLYDEAAGSVAPAEASELKTVGERDRELGVAVADRPVEVSVSQITVIDRGTADHPGSAHKNAAGEQSPASASPRKRSARRHARKTQDERRN